MASSITDNDHSTMEQSLYWKELFQLKVHSHYIELFLKKSETHDRCINMILAISSTASIGAWAIWNNYAMVWGLIIAGSQVIQAIRPYLPYNELLKCAAGLRNSYSELFVFADTKWPSIASGELSKAEIASLREQLRAKKLQYEQKAFPSSGFPDNEKFIEKATQKAELYFANFYGD